MSTVPLEETEVNALISAAFNSELAGVCLMGIYAMIYFGTMYACVVRFEPLNRMVVTTVSILFLINVANWGVQWNLGDVAFVQQSSSPDAIFSGFFESPQSLWSNYVGVICSYVAGLLADGLMIWRCFHIWGQSARAIVLPMVLFFCELAVDISVLVLPSNAGQAANTLAGVPFVVTFACTVLCTSLIGYRIQSYSIDGALRKRYKRVIEMIVESAALYSMVALAYAIVILTSFKVPPNSQPSVALIIGAGYLGNFYNSITGIASTILVARVALTHGRDGHSTGTMGSGPIAFKPTSASSPSALPQDEESGMEPARSATVADAADHSQRE